MRWMAAVLCAIMLVGCASSPMRPPVGKTNRVVSRPDAPQINPHEGAREIVMYALGLIDVGYQFGGKNPESGLDCSGMVAFIFKNALGLVLPHNAAEIARTTRPIERKQLAAGDLVFFNTRNKPFSHVGIYIGDDKFVHAPSTNGRIRIDSMKANYFAQRYEAARSVF